MFAPMAAPETIAFINNIFGVDGLVILVVGLLIFGRRLPEVGKNLGKTIVEFKKGLNGSYSNEEEAAAEEPEQRPAKKLASTSSAGRVAASTPARKRLPETEEV